MSDYWFFLLIRQLSSEWEATRIEALHWISTLLSRHRTEVTGHLWWIICRSGCVHVFLSFAASLKIIWFAPWTFFESFKYFKLLNSFRLWYRKSQALICWNESWYIGGVFKKEGNCVSFSSCIKFLWNRSWCNLYFLKLCKIEYL